MTLSFNLSLDSIILKTRKSRLEVVVDTKGMACPMPIIKLKKSLAENLLLESLFLLELTDAGGLSDVPAFCRQQGLEWQLLKEKPYIVFKVWRKAE